MKYLEFYKTELGCNTEEEVFSFLVDRLKPGNITWSWFVNWEKVFANVKKVELALNTLNYLIGKENFDEEFRFLLRQQPELASVIPLLLVRVKGGEKQFQILASYPDKNLRYENFDFSGGELSADDLEKCLRFVQETGLKDLIMNRKVKNLVDYMVGVEAGIDSNARKNRGGNFMETIVELFIREACANCGGKYLKQATIETIKEELNHDIPGDKMSRRYDFAVSNGSALFVIETNFYNSAGSKSKATAGEYQNLFKLLEGKCEFLWIIDGRGWLPGLNPLRETFDLIDHIFNLAMLERGVLEFLLQRR